MGGVWGGATPPRDGVRRVLDAAVDRAVTRSDAQLVAYWATTVAVAVVLRLVGRRLSRD